MAQRTLPSVPVKHADLVEYLLSHPDEPVRDLFKPYNDYDAVLRQIFAQEPDHPVIADGLLNVVPLYDVERGGAADLRIRARNLATESDDVKTKYIMPLSDEDRRPDGSFAVVPSLKQFQTNFSIFSEGSLSSLNWDNVLAMKTLNARFANSTTRSLLLHPTWIFSYTAWITSKPLKRSSTSSNVSTILF
ncbi:hypothetical protein ASPCAL15042 [Aspergillus calidoustus]|uniref:Uncharacterized protein n=1 Tax=Aspergillus calidoustus TaxID=454130 RepID=A0A0U5CKP7_ASPCI|nr:hypothetical protein ASPCAL15042 [Aspergillus calidoustus]